MSHQKLLFDKKEEERACFNEKGGQGTCFRLLPITALSLLLAEKGILYG
jgi:hypothetical protein